MYTLLLIEDDIEFAELIKGFLEERNINTVICDDPFKALVLNLKVYDLVLLDLGLPGMDGLEVCKSLRQKSTIPIIISSARGSVSDKVLGLEVGADDYLPKPYDPDELVARIMSILRRVNEQFNTPTRAFVIDKNLHDISFCGKLLGLTEAEFEVFATLIRQYEAVVSKEQLVASVSSIRSADGNSLEVLISKIRQKIKPFSQKKHIVSLRGRGYRVVE